MNKDNLTGYCGGMQLILDDFGLGAYDQSVHLQ